MEARFLFIAPPNLADLERRLRDRGTETEDKVRLRMSRAKHEISYTERPGFFDDVVVNDDLERAYSAFESIMLSHADQPRP